MSLARSVKLAACNSFLEAALGMLSSRSLDSGAPMLSSASMQAWLGRACSMWDMWVEGTDSSNCRWSSFGRPCSNGHCFSSSACIEGIA